MASISSSNPSLRDASFSSYLNTSEESYIHSLVESSQKLNHHQVICKQKKEEDEEIDVFSADKYFNGGIIEEGNNIRLKSAAKYQQQNTLKDHNTNTTQVVNGHSRLKVQLQPPTPSNHSESSWNSQTALLRHLHRTPPRTTTNKGGIKEQEKRSFFRCSCCDKKSVDIDREFYHGIRDTGDGKGIRPRPIKRSIKTDLEVAEITRVNKLQLDYKDAFALPASDPLSALHKIQLQDDQDQKDEQEEEPRKSLEVFGSSEADEGSKRFILERRLNMLSWDAIFPPRSAEEINTSGAPSDLTYKDTESDTSSDLFEIPCTANPVAHRPRRPSDGGGSATPTTRYAPSEASIEWSVVTASAADFSIVSDSEDHRMASKPPSSAKLTINKEVKKPRSGLLLGCKSQKAVRVAGDNVYRSPSRMNRYPSDSFTTTTPITRFQAEVKLAGFGHRQRQSLSSDLF